MKIILGHDIVVQEIEGSCWKALKIIIFLQEQMSDMDLHFIYSLLKVFLFVSVEPFGIPQLTVVAEIIFKTDV